MKITYLAHACFFIETSNRKIITDPYSNTIGYAPLNKEADIVTISHDHFDHNAVEEVKGSPLIKKDVFNQEFNGVKVWGLQSFHDKSGGSQRGKNIIFVIESEGLKLAHFGDQGTIPQEDIIQKLKDIHIALIPVGGFFTIGPEEATQIINILQPPIVIPMHYKTSKLNFDIQKVEGFLNLNKDKKILMQDDGWIEINTQNLPVSTQIVVLKHLR